MQNSYPISWSIATNNLTKSQLKTIKTHLTDRSYKAKTTIFSQNERPTELFIVAKGRVRLIYYTAKGNAFTLGIWGKGYVVGLMSAYLGDRRFVSLESVGNSHMAVLSRINLIELMRTIPVFSLNITTLIAQQGREGLQRLVLLASDRTIIQLCRILLQLGESTQNKLGSSEIVVSGISQEELASLTGTSRVWINHMLADLENRKLIEREKMRIVIHNPIQFVNSMIQHENSI